MNTPKIQYSHRRPRSTSVEIPNIWSEVRRNISPMRIPTVLIEAWSNWRITSPTATQNTPETSHSHQRLERLRTACGACP
jgi:hypothetical protein